MCEPHEPVLDVLDMLAKQGFANPFGCAITRCPVWYLKGISKDWNEYGGNSYGMSRSGTPLVEYTDVYNEAKQLAEQYPGKAFVGKKEPTVKEVVTVREKLGLPVVLERQSNGSCLICAHMRQTGLGLPPYETDEDEDDDFGDYDERLDTGGGGF
jgi:hypothetical protein